MSTEAPTAESSAPTSHVVADAGAKPAEEPLGAPGLAALKTERELKAAAEKRATDAEARVKAFEDEKKTVEQRQADALAAAKAELAALTDAKTRAEIANTKSVPVGVLAGPASNSSEDLAAFADALIAFKGQVQPQKLHVPNEGNSPTNQGTTEQEFIGALFGGK